MNIATLFARIGIKDEASATLENFKRGLSSAVRGLTVMAAGITAFEAAMNKALHDSMRLAFGLRQFEAESGQSSQTLQEWTGVAAQMGIGAEAISASVQALAENREKIKLGQGNISGYQMLGINPMDDPFKVLSELREKTAGMPQAMKKNLLASLGVSAQFMQMLELTNGQFERMKANAFVIPESTLASIQQTEGNLNALGNMIKWFEALLAQKLGPQIQKITDAVIRWVKENKDGLLDGLSKLFTWVTKVIGAVFTVAGMIGEVISHTVGWKTAILGFLAVWALFNAGLLASPITWIIAGIMALILVMDDLYHYQKGDKKSLFGEFAKASPAFKKLLDGVLGVIKDLVLALDRFFKSDYSGFADILSKWGAFGTVLTVAAGALKQIFDLIGDILGLDLSKLGKDLFTNDFWNKVHLSDKDIIGNVGNFFSGLFGGKTPPAQNNIQVVNHISKDGIKTDVRVNGQDFTRQALGVFSDQRLAGRSW